MKLQREYHKDTPSPEEVNEGSWQGFSPPLDEREAELSQRQFQQALPYVDSWSLSCRQSDILELNKLLSLAQTQRILNHCM